MKKVKYLVLSDLHLGHRVNKTERIARNILKFFQQYQSILNNINILFIAGDVFDRLLPTYSPEYVESNKALVWIVKWCIAKNVKLRILEGTPSHDWSQASMISKIIEELQVEVDYKYISTLEVERMKDLDLSILYIPDEYKSKAIDTFNDVKKLLKKEQLDKVDVVIMHGAFKYQLPFDLESSHVEKDYIDITKYFIHVGHIHTHTNYKNKIIAQGSFDRLAHGEDEPKGGVVADLSTGEWLFLPNERAMIFKTLDLSHLEDQDEIVRSVKDFIKTIPTGSSLRIVLNDKDKLIGGLKNFKNLTEMYNIKIKVPNVKTLSMADTIVENNNIKAFSIHKNNILLLVEEELKALNLTDDNRVRILNKFKLIKEKIDASIT